MVDKIAPVPPVYPVSDPQRKLPTAEDRGLSPKRTHLPEDKTDGYALIDAQSNPISADQARQLLDTSLMANEQYHTALAPLKATLTNVVQNKTLTDDDTTELLTANGTVAALARSTYSKDGTTPSTDSSSLAQINAFHALASSFGITRDAWLG